MNLINTNIIQNNKINLIRLFYNHILIIQKELNATD